MVYLGHMEGGPNKTGQSVVSWRGLRQFIDGAVERLRKAVHGQSELRILGRRSASAGFTVIEVLIVLAVSGMLFVSAAIMISGRQNQTGFDQSIRQVQSQVQQTISDVATGYYPNSENFRCTISGGNPTLSAGAAAQGSNSGCIFVGKALQFGVGAANSNLFNSYTIAGVQRGGAGGGETSSMAEANPTVVAPGATHNSAGYPDNTVQDELQNGLTPVRMWYNNGGGDVAIGAVAFTNSFAQFSGGSVVSGAGQVNVIPVNNTSLGNSKTVVVEAMNGDGGDRLTSSPANPTQGVFMCFDSGGTNQWGIIRIGGERRTLSVTLTIKNKTAGLCTYP
jgi:prepilin-type N-terminal cleavage/methylation domain-containing protein